MNIYFLENLIYSFIYLFIFTNFGPTQVLPSCYTGMFYSLYVFTLWIQVNSLKEWLKSKEVVENIFCL